MPSSAIHPTPLRTALRHLFPWLLLASLIAAVCALVRFELIEPAAWREACATPSWQGWCGVRRMTIELFQQQRIGWFAVTTGVLGMLLRRRWLGALALLSGVASVLLYAVEPGAFGVLLGVLLLLGNDTTSDDTPGQTAAVPTMQASDRNTSA